MIINCRHKNPRSSVRMDTLLARFRALDIGFSNELLYLITGKYTYSTIQHFNYDIKIRTQDFLVLVKLDPCPSAKRCIGPLPPPPPCRETKALITDHQSPPPVYGPIIYSFAISYSLVRLNLTTLEHFD